MERKGILLSLGRRFKENGDLGRALKCAKGTNSTEEAAQIQRKIKILRTASLFENAGLEKAAAELLLSNSMMEEAIELINRISKRPTDSSCFACALVYAKNGEFELAASYVENLANSGPRGQYLIGLVLAEVNLQGAEYMADFLSEKPHDAKPVQKPPEESRLFFSVSSQTGVEKAVKGMLSIMLWHMDDPAERYYCALRIYQKIGKPEEANRCLDLLEEKKGRFYMYALMALGKDWKNKEFGSIYQEGQAMRIIAERDVQTLIRYLDRRWYEKDAKERCNAYAGIIEELELFAFGIDRQLNFHALEHLTRRFSIAREEIAEKERVRIARVERLISFADFKRARLAHRLIGNINRRYLDEAEKKRLSGYRRACADIASRLEIDKEAQFFAAEEYSRLLDASAALVCAERLLALGEAKKAKNIIASLELDRSTAEKTAERLEQQWPLISFGLFLKLGDTDAIRRTAERVLSEGSMDQVEAIGWKLSCYREEKQGPLMMKLLERLKSFGEDGEKSANCICIEMRIKPLFVAN